VASWEFNLHKAYSSYLVFTCVSAFVSSCPYWFIRCRSDVDSQGIIATFLFMWSMFEDGVYGMFMYSHAMIQGLFFQTIPITYDGNYIHFHKQHGELLNGAMHLVGIWTYHALTFSMLIKLCATANYSLRYFPMIFPVLSAIFWLNFEAPTLPLFLSAFSDATSFWGATYMARMSEKNIVFALIVSAELCHGVLGHGIAFNLGNLEMYDGAAERRTHEAFLLPSTINVMIDVVFHHLCSPTPVFKC